MTTIEPGYPLMYVETDGHVYMWPKGDMAQHVVTVRAGDGTMLAVDDLPGLRAGDMLTIEDDGEFWRVVRTRTHWWTLYSRAHRKVIRQMRIIDSEENL